MMAHPDDAPEERPIPPSGPTVAPVREPADAPPPGDPDLVPPGTAPDAE
jgi:hypothetical protein